MRKLAIILIVVVLIIISVPIILLSGMGFVPGISTLLGTNKPRDLGVTFTQKDLEQCRSKSAVKYLTHSGGSNPSSTRKFEGEHQVNTEFSSEEITATMNNQPWGLWPYRNVQVKFNADGSGEISGVFLKDKLVPYGQTIGAPKEALDFAQKFLPNNPVFYVKMKVSLVNNSIATFEPQSFQIGRMPMPLNMFLSMGGMDLIGRAYAQNERGMSEELSKVRGKKQIIIDFINARLSSDFGKFYAKKAYFGDNKLYFDGTLTDSISYSP